MISTSRRPNGYIAIEIKQLSRMALNIVETGDRRKAGIVWALDRFVAYDLQCPHMGGDLSQGRCQISDMSIQCPWHGYVFDLQTGQLRENPNIKDTAILRRKSEHFDPDAQPAYRLRSYVVRLSGDELEILTAKSGTV